ncbi:MAG: DUF1499 domain-containing protein [Planctomycetaceae bacterium]|nr:DUF1499 domain-containing protein [Planctomycetaceae bacterium]
MLLAPVVAFAILSASARRPGNLGVVDGRLADCPPSPNCVCTQAAAASHQAQPIPFTGSAAEAADRLRAVLSRQPRTAIITDRGDYLHAEATSLLFRYVDDVEFFIDADKQVIHFRSASRVGHSDLDVNRGRMQAIRTAFLAE